MSTRQAVAIFRHAYRITRAPRSQQRFGAAPALWQHGFELPPHPFKVTAQFGDYGTVRQVRTVHVVGYEGYSKPSATGVLGANKKPKTKGANCERRHPGGNGITTQPAEEPGGDGRYKSCATDQNCVVSHSCLRFWTMARNDRGTALTSL